MFQIPFLDLPALHSVHGTLRLPGSKSISNRALLLAALADGRTVLHDLLESEDTQVMQDALRALGGSVVTEGRKTTVAGIGAGSHRQQAELFLANAGTAMRPLTAVLAVLGGEYRLDGVPRMRERPIGDLVDALRAIGCNIDYLGKEGYPPLLIRPPQLRLDRPIPVRGSVSSQFLTGLLMALPLASTAHDEDITVEVVGELISRPYVDITIAMLERFGVQVQCPDPQHFVIPAGSRYRSPGSLRVEADASSASYFIAAASLSRAEPGAEGLRLEGLGSDSVQGDIRFVDAARRMGASIEAGPDWLHIRPAPQPLRAVDLDCNHIPDAAMTLAMLALYADGPSTLHNIASWRVKETDRLSAMATELRKLGARVDEGPDWLRVQPIAADHWRPASLHTYDDHRMAMCASLAAFNPDGQPIRIQDPACVVKTYPDYFEALLERAVAQGPVPVICVDGPSASGKGTLAQALAQRLGYHHLDSGVLYRVAGLVARRQGLLEPAQADELGALVAELQLRWADGRTWLGAEDVTQAIRSEQTGMDASLVSSWPAVRRALLALQHKAARLPGLVADGRDMGSVIFPQAALKVFLTASVAERARRRHEQLKSRGIQAKIEDLRADLEARDARDRSRAESPLVAASDALQLDNSTLSIEQTVERVLDWWQQRQPFAAGNGNENTA